MFCGVGYLLFFSFGGDVLIRGGGGGVWFLDVWYGVKWIKGLVSVYFLK